jgi:hypothetical protein
VTPFPQNCPYCKASRAGVQDSAAYFLCGAVARRVGEGLRWTRPVKCVLAEREKSRLDESDSTGVPE